MTPPDDEAAPAADADLAAAREALARAEAALAETKERETRAQDQLRRLAADFDNHRKRQAREMDEARVRAREEVIQRILDVLSNFDRALEAHGDAEALHQGMTLIHRQMKNALEAIGVQRIDTEGHPFDPALHEAVLREETTRYKDGVVIAELEKGYTLHGRVLRPARVKVAAAPPADAAPPDDAPPP